MCGFFTWLASKFCVHRWEVDAMASDQIRNTVILKCRLCFKTEAMQWRDSP